MQNAIAGDTVYFLAGVYNVGPGTTDNYHGALEPSNSGSPNSPITFAAYPEATVTLNGTANAGADAGTVLGVNGNDYITFDGFNIQSDNGVKMGRILIWGRDTGIAYGVTVKNTVVYGGTTVIASTDNREGIRVDRTDGTLLHNVKVYSFRQVNNWHNTSCYKGYNNNNLIIEKSEFFNCSLGIYWKRTHDNSIVRYSYIHDNYNGMNVYAYLSNNNVNSTIENNVFSKNQYQSLAIIGEDGATSDNFDINNNTFYGTASGAYALWFTEGTNWKIWNNVIQGFANKQYTNGYGNIQLSESDHNQFGSAPLTITTHQYQSNKSLYSSVTDWKSSGELSGGGNPGEASLASDPQFVNTSGTFSKATDFELAPDSPSRGTGRNGTNMGADINLVGYKSNTKVPKAPVLH
jgi:hypothetical protein